MKSSKNTQTRGHEYVLLAVIVAIILLVATQSLFSQFKIGGITIDGVKRPTVTKNGNRGGRTESRSGDKDTNSSESQDAGDDPPAWLLSYVGGLVGDIESAREEVDIYTAEGRMYLVSSPLSPWLLRAVSQKARDEFAIDKKINEWRKANPGNKFDNALDALAASAAKKLPQYLPKTNQFALRDAAIEQMMKAKLKNAATLKISKIGVLHANWQIEKNDLGIPTSRYREAFIWGKDPSDDHPYCHVYGFVIQQDYSGGGTYGASFAYLNTDVLFGCPTK